jgi:hypothetical protein
VKCDCSSCYRGERLIYFLGFILGLTLTFLLVFFDWMGSEMAIDEFLSYFF